MERPSALYFGEALSFGDRRLDRRFCASFDQMAERPDGTLPKKLVGRAPLVGGYRMFNNAKRVPSAILSAHQRHVLGKLSGRSGRWLLIHDTTELDYSGLSIPELGLIGKGTHRGMHAHNSLLVDAQSCEVVGLVNQILHYRRSAPKGETKRQRRQRPERESHLWKRAVAGLPALPDVTDVSDRGSDLTEYLAYEVQAHREFIVRSCHNRNLADPSLDGTVIKLHDTLRQLTPAATQLLSVRTERGAWRQAEVGLAWQIISVQPPAQASGEHGREPLILTGIIVREIGAPQGVEPLEWILLTNRVVTCVAEAQQVVADYGRRWIIEEYHKVLKTGCGIETLQLTTRHGLENAIVSTSVLAVHVLNLRHWARDENRATSPAHQHDDPLKVRLAAHHVKHTNWKAMTVWEYYVAVARLDGYVLNPRQRPPGWQILWRGYIRLHDMASGARVLAEGERCVQT
jgi:hypothetical protein